METITFAIVILVALAALVVFDVLAIRYGVDSRETIGDGYARANDEPNERRDAAS